MRSGWTLPAVSPLRTRRTRGVRGRAVLRAGLGGEAELGLLLMVLECDESVTFKVRIACLAGP